MGSAPLECFLPDLTGTPAHVRPCVVLGLMRAKCLLTRHEPASIGSAAGTKAAKGLLWEAPEANMHKQLKLFLERYTKAQLASMLPAAELPACMAGLHPKLPQSGFEPETYIETLTYPHLYGYERVALPLSHWGSVTLRFYTCILYIVHGWHTTSAWWPVYPCVTGEER